MSLIIIAAISENNVIGRGNEIPWHIPEDLQRFRQITLGHPVIMGRKTFGSIINSLGKPLPKRRNVVITSKRDFCYEGIYVVHSVEEAVSACKNQDSYVIGGREVFSQMLPIADRMELTRVHRNVEGNVFFPEVNWEEWNELNREDKEEYSFVSYARK